MLRQTRKRILLYRSNGEKTVIHWQQTLRLEDDEGRGRVEGGMTNTEVMARCGIANVAVLER